MVIVKYRRALAPAKSFRAASTVVERSRLAAGGAVDTQAVAVHYAAEMGEGFEVEVSAAGRPTALAGSMGGAV